ncbi:hypothetical protein [Aquimarina algicola]|uniref:Uncharacterized protein n=1 Tax=Aquimarina algicola TaxID=2589995 RepID=A0A504J826_9FLAO|nr:hypothetical protein [Aquimarina algicola]TPN84745.1 hypothetical protein FHK87_17610 [Aquimarina algicola]
MKKTVFLVMLLAVLIGTTSCGTSDYKIINSSDVKHTFILNSSKSFRGYFYKGSDQDYHYFASKWDFESDNLFKMKKEDLKIESTYQFGKKETEIDIIATDKLFAKNEFYQLYYIQ